METVVLIAGLFLTLLINAVGVAWKLRGMETELLRAIRAAESETRTLVDEARQSFGETASALRTKINEVELFTRDTFIRRDNFYSVQAGLEGSIVTLSKRMDDGFDKLRDQINSK